MAGFEDVINFLKDANSGKLNSTGGLNSILDKINDAVNIEKVALKATASPQRTKTGTPKRTKKVDKPKSEDERAANQQKREASNEVIMKHSLNHIAEVEQAAYDLSNFNFDVTPDSMIQGIVYSEILARPISKRRGGRRRR